MEQLSVPDDFFDKAETPLKAQTIQRADSANVLKRAAKGDRIAVKDCVNKYGNLIWTLAKKFTVSDEDAEAATQEIFLEIWRCVSRFEQAGLDESLFIKLIALRQLKKYSEKSRHSNV